MRRPMPIVLAHWLAGFWRCRARVVTRVRRSSTYVVRLNERSGGLVCPSVVMCQHSFRAVIDTIRYDTWAPTFVSFRGGLH